MNKNICKFIDSKNQDVLEMVNFIFESDRQNQSLLRTLSANVAFLISKGSASFQFNGKTTLVSPGMLIFGFTGERFKAVGEELEYYYISFTGLRSNELFRRFAISPDKRCFTAMENLLPFWKENILRTDEQNIDIVSECVLLYTLSKLTPSHLETEDIAVMLLRYAEENFTDSTLSLNTIADQWGYNSKYLSNRFKNKMNIGFSKYIKNLRIERAVFLMDHGVCSVKNVAYLCGFGDSLYFSKVFREEIGVPPTQYIEQKNMTIK